MDAEHEASQALMRNGERMSGHGSSAVDGFQLSVDGGSSSEDGAQLIPDPHQPAQVVTSMDDGILLHPDTDDFPEDDIYMEDDTYMEDEDGSWDDDSSSGEYEPSYYDCHFFTIRKELLHSFVKHLRHGLYLADALLSACQEVPGVQGLADLRRLLPVALPSWLASDEFLESLGYLEVRAGNHVIFTLASLSRDVRAREAKRKEELQRFGRCRFQEGFASEGMLCNSPPLPLRVLDYLEAADLLSLSLVCKATHRASHYLFRLEEEVLKRPGIQDSNSPLGHLGLQFNHPSAAAWHRKARTASLMCGRPEAIDVPSWRSTLLHSFVAAPGECTQPRVSWESYRVKDRHVAEMVNASRVTVVGHNAWMVDPEGWPSGDQGVLARLKRIYDGEDVDPLVLDELEGIPRAFRLYGDTLEEAVKGVANVFEVAREHKQFVFVVQIFRGNCKEASGCGVGRAGDIPLLR